MFLDGLNVMSEHKHQTSSYIIHQVTHGGEDADKAINFTVVKIKVAVSCVIILEDSAASIFLKKRNVVSHILIMPPFLLYKFSVLFLAVLILFYVI
jgi:hypothetical protein